MAFNLGFYKDKPGVKYRPRYEKVAFCGNLPIWR